MLTVAATSYSLFLYDVRLLLAAFLRAIYPSLFIATMMRPSTIACTFLALAASSALAAPIIALERDNLITTLVNTLAIRDQTMNQPPITPTGIKIPPMSEFLPWFDRYLPILPKRVDQQDTIYKIVQYPNSKDLYTPTSGYWPLWYGLGPAITSTKGNARDVQSPNEREDHTTTDVQERDLVDDVLAQFVRAVSARSNKGFYRKDVTYVISSIE
jgi:hypothetical protein